MNGGHCFVYGPHRRITATLASRRASASKTALMKAVVPMLRQEIFSGGMPAIFKTSRTAISIPSETSGVVGALNWASTPLEGS